MACQEHLGKFEKYMCRTLYSERFRRPGAELGNWVFWERIPPSPGNCDGCSRLRTTALDGKASWWQWLSPVCLGVPCCTCHMIPFIIHSEICAKHWFRRKPCAPHLSWEGSVLCALPVTSVSVALQGPHSLTIWRVWFSCVMITHVFPAAGFLLI